MSCGTHLQSKSVSGSWTFFERSALTAECYLVTIHARKPAMSASRIKVLPAT